MWDNVARNRFRSSYFCELVHCPSNRGIPRRCLNRLELERSEFALGTERLHHSSLIAQVESIFESPQFNVSTLNRMVQTLKTRRRDIEATLEEEEIKEEIKQAGIYHKKLDLAIISLQIQISKLELAELRLEGTCETRETTAFVVQDRADTRDNVHTRSQENDNPTPRLEPDRDTRSPVVSSLPVSEARRVPRVKFDGHLRNGLHSGTCSNPRYILTRSSQILNVQILALTA